MSPITPTERRAIAREREDLQASIVGLGVVIDRHRGDADVSSIERTLAEEQRTLAEIHATEREIASAA